MKDALDAETRTAAVTLLCTSLLVHVDPSVMDQFSGPRDLSTAILTSWVALIVSRGRRLRLTTPIFSWAVSYATRASLPPPTTSTTSSTGIATLAAKEDAVMIAPLHVEFVMTSPWPGTISRGEALAVLARTITADLTWVKNFKRDEVVGYAILGRATPRTISLRNIYVAPEHRRQGIAEAMVRAITRYYLGMHTSGIPEDLPSVGVNEEVNLLVDDPGAERVYRRAGFLFPDRSGEALSGGRDPSTGQKVWYHALWQGVEPEPSH
ncbi:hypothetical protein C8T65DRAFT_91622 [Cerioporus squamosus]|nr:hypothetical protein C8T65DRAFT_91622 [Cerioporus squamosus]